LFDVLIGKIDLLMSPRRSTEKQIPKEVREINPPAEQLHALMRFQTNKARLTPTTILENVLHFLLIGVEMSAL
jgi:hypothetical protein